MAGGVIMVLNLNAGDRLVGNYLATGMVGGAIYIRGRVKDLKSHYFLIRRKFSTTYVPLWSTK